MERLCFFIFFFVGSNLSWLRTLWNYKQAMFPKSHPFSYHLSMLTEAKYTWEITHRLELCIFFNVQRCRWWIPKVPRHWGHWKKQLAPNSQVLVLLSALLRWTCIERKSIAGGLCWSGNTFPQAMFGCDARLWGPNVDSVPWLHSPGIQIILEGRVNTSYFSLSCLELGNS